MMNQDFQAYNLKNPSLSSKQKEGELHILKE